MTKEEEWDGEVFSISPYELVPADPAYSAYNGSLTTPPCSEVILLSRCGDGFLVGDLCKCPNVLVGRAMRPFVSYNHAGLILRSLWSLCSHPYLLWTLTGCSVDRHERPDTHQ